MLTTFRLLNESVPQSVGCDIGVGREAHFFQNAASIGADGFYAQAEFIRDVRNAPSGRQLAKNLEFARRQPRMQGLVRIAVEVRHQYLSERGADVTPPSSLDGADRAPCRSLDDILTAPVLCVALPWGGDLPVEMAKNRFHQLNPQLVLVVWRRSRAIERAIAHLGKHYAEPVQLCNLAKIACISKCHLVRLFTATLGMSPHRYQLVLRLSRAKTMLREGTCITQIAQGVGFFDHSHLDRSFRILIGMTPTQYQQSVAR